MTRQLVKRHRATIQRVAEALMERGTLSGGELDALMPAQAAGRLG